MEGDRARYRLEGLCRQENASCAKLIKLAEGPDVPRAADRTPGRREIRRLTGASFARALCHRQLGADARRLASPSSPPASFSRKAWSCAISSMRRLTGRTSRDLPAGGRDVPDRGLRAGRRGRRHRGAGGNPAGQSIACDDCSSTSPRFAFVAFFSWKSWTLLHEAWVDGRVTSSTWGPPLWIPLFAHGFGHDASVALQIAVQIAV